ncbi:MAG: electron transfer flavoprotein subunit beta/FixA family protein [Pseudomonadota bacterium]|nr:electron transfer flavoprotein subunit beta/FixA family protein [Pseudomonadota bacterium]
MKVIAFCKRVVDYNVQIQIKPDGSEVVTDGVKMSMNPFDEIAVEEGVRLKEQGHVHELIAVSLGEKNAEDVLRQALAMGADRAILVENDTQTPIVEPRIIAKIMAAVINHEQPDCVLLGKQAIDYDHNQTGQMLAGLLGWPQATFASNIQMHDQGFLVEREIDGGLETIKVSKPAIITTDLRLNTPRFIALPNIIKAKSKPLKTVSCKELNIDTQPQIQFLGVEAPPTRTQGVIDTDLDEFLQRLTQKGVLL